MAFAVVRLTSEMLDALIQERLRSDATPDWVYDVVVEIDPAQLQANKPNPPALPKASFTTASATKAVAGQVTVSTAIQGVAPA